MSGKRLASVGIGLALSAALLWSALGSMDFAAFGKAVKSADLRFVPLLALGCLLTLWLRVERWRLLLPPGAPRGALFRLITIGLAVNNVLPARLGELARALLATRELKLPLLTVLASILIERLLDGLTILALYLAAAAAMPENPWVRETLPVFAPLFGSLLAGFLGAFLLEWSLESLPGPARLLRGHPRVKALADQLVLGLRPLRSPAALAPVLLWGLALWCVDGGNYFFAAKAVPLEAEVSYPYAAVVMATAGMSTLLPAAPGYIGLIEFAVMKSVVPLGVSPESAFAYAAFLHMVVYALVTTLGIFFLYREGSSLAEVWRTAHKEKSG